MRPGLVCMLLCVALGGGCRTTVDPALLVDAQIAARVRTALVNHAELGRMPIEVRVRQGIARLSGAVETDTQVGEAERLVRTVQGVRDVEVDLRIGGTADTPIPLPLPADPGDRELSSSSTRRLIALGVSVGRSSPADAALGSRLSAGPLIRLGSGRGLGPAIAFNWFQTSLEGPAAGPLPAGRIHVKPIMAGLGYTFASRHLSVSPSLVGGLAFNGASVDDTGPVGRVAVAVDNSFAWRPGLSIWLDLGPRVAVNVSAGQVRTRLHVTFVEDAQLVRRELSGNTAILQAGLAYKVF